MEFRLAACMAVASAGAPALLLGGVAASGKGGVDSTGEGGSAPEKAELKPSNSLVAAAGLGVTERAWS